MVAEAQQVAESAGALGALGVDGKLFLAQLVNFGIVVFVMWKWVYTPLLKVMDERTRKIEQGLKDAEESATARRKAEEEGAGVIAGARKQAKTIMDEALAAAEAERQESVRRARAEVEKVVSQGREQLASEKRKMVAEAKAEVGSLVALATGRILGEKIDPAKDAKLIEKAIKEVDRAI